MDATDEELARLAKALGHPVRVRIVRLLRALSGCVCTDLTAELPLSHTTVWQHLKVLKESGIVRGTITGPRLCYCLDEAVLNRLGQLVSGLSQSEELCKTPVEDQGVES